MVDGAVDLLGARQNAGERILQAVGQPIHHLRDFRLRIGELPREGLRTDDGAVEPSCDSVFLHARERDGKRGFRLVLERKILRAAAADRCDRIFEGLAAIGIVDAGIPPKKFLQRRHVAGQRLRIRSRRVEADLVEEIAVLLARTESRAAPDRESEEVRKSFAVGPIHRQQDESGRCIGLRRDRLRLASAGCAGAAPSSCHGSSPCKSKMSSWISKV